MSNTSNANKQPYWRDSDSDEESGNEHKLQGIEQSAVSATSVTSDSGQSGDIMQQTRSESFRLDGSQNQTSSHSKHHEHTSHHTPPLPMTETEPTINSSFSLDANILPPILATATDLSLFTGIDASLQHRQHHHRRVSLDSSDDDDDEQPLHGHGDADRSTVTAATLPDLIPDPHLTLSAADHPIAVDGGVDDDYERTITPDRSGTESEKDLLVAVSGRKNLPPETETLATADPRPHDADRVQLEHDHRTDDDEEEEEEDPLPSERDSTGLPIAQTPSLVLPLPSVMNQPSIPEKLGMTTEFGTPCHAISGSSNGLVVISNTPLINSMSPNFTSPSPSSIYNSHQLSPSLSPLVLPVQNGASMHHPNASDSVPLLVSSPDSLSQLQPQPQSESESQGRHRSQGQHAHVHMDHTETDGVRVVDTAPNHQYEYEARTDESQLPLATADNLSPTNISSTLDIPVPSVGKGKRRKPRKTLISSDDEEHNTTSSASASTSASASASLVAPAVDPVPSIEHENEDGNEFPSNIISMPPIKRRKGASGRRKIRVDDDDGDGDDDDDDRAGMLEDEESLAEWSVSVRRDRRHTTEERGEKRDKKKSQKKQKKQQKQKKSAARDESIQDPTDELYDPDESVDIPTTSGQNGNGANQKEDNDNHSTIHALDKKLKKLKKKQKQRRVQYDLSDDDDGRGPSAPTASTSSLQYSPTQEHMRRRNVQMDEDAVESYEVNQQPEDRRQDQGQDQEQQLRLNGEIGRQRRSKGSKTILLDDDHGDDDGALGASSHSVVDSSTRSTSSHSQPAERRSKQRRKQHPSMNSSVDHMHEVDHASRQTRAGSVLSSSDTLPAAAACTSTHEPDRMISPLFHLITHLNLPELRSFLASHPSPTQLLQGHDEAGRLICEVLFQVIGDYGGDHPDIPHLIDLLMKYDHDADFFTIPPFDSVRHSHSHRRARLTQSSLVSSPHDESMDGLVYMDIRNELLEHLVSATGRQCLVQEAHNESMDTTLAELDSAIATQRRMVEHVRTQLATTERSLIQQRQKHALASMTLDKLSDELAILRQKEMHDRQQMLLLQGKIVYADSVDAETTFDASMPSFSRAHRHSRTNMLDLERSTNQLQQRRALAVRTKKQLRRMEAEQFEAIQLATERRNELQQAERRLDETASRASKVEEVLVAAAFERHTHLICTLKIRARYLQRRMLLRKPNPFLRLYRKKHQHQRQTPTPTVELDPIHDHQHQHQETSHEAESDDAESEWESTPCVETGIIRSSTDPTWSGVCVPLAELVGGDWRNAFKIEVWNCLSHALTQTQSESDIELLGAATCTFAQLATLATAQPGFIRHPTSTPSIHGQPATATAKAKAKELTPPFLPFHAHLPSRSSVSELTLIHPIKGSRHHPGVIQIHEISIESESEEPQKRKSKF